MKEKPIYILKYLRKTPAFVLLLFVMASGCISASAQSVIPLRRPASPEKPMWLIHIDSWNYADPQKLIDLIPKDIRPYVVMNISVSINHDATTGKWLQAEYAYEIAKSWLRVCAENRMWAMVQQSSGGFQHFSDFDLKVYEELYRDYPNLIGFNYAEQFWGYDDPFSVSWTQRMALFANLVKLSNKYGGYLMVSWCGNEWSPNINPMAMMKRNPDFVAATRQFSKNFILCEKYTQQSYQSDMESLCLGAYLSGFSGQYGIRYDDTGWTDINGQHANFSMATAGAPYLEHMMLTGQTVIDGPELIMIQQSRELSTGSTADGYSTRRWELYPQFYNVTLDIFRKVVDGTVRIPSRKEVIDRTKVAIIHDVNAGSNDDIYSTPASLFEGLYRMDGDGNLKDNKSFFKKTGRYPTIPTVFQFTDADANSFQVKVNKSAYSSRWPNIAAKVNEFNNLFPKEYSGDIYAGRHENGWVVYNPFKTGQTASGRIPFKYNTCDSIELSFSQYTSGVIKETSNRLNIYLNNYDNMINTGLKTDVIKIYGSTAEPTYTFTDRANHQPSTITKSWSEGVLSLTIQHNGALDITVNCSGSATGRLSSYKTAAVLNPELPAAYSGPHQYEAENFDYKNINGNVTNGINAAIRNYTAQGYLRFGTNSAASIRKTITALQPGSYLLETKYTASAGDVNSIDLYVNGVKVGTPVFVKTASDSEWAINTQTITLKAGENTIMYSANKTGTNAIIFDNIVVSGSTGTRYDFNQDLATSVAGTPPARLMTLRSGTAGVSLYTGATDGTSNMFKAYSGGAKNATGVADLDLFPGTADYSVIWKEYDGGAGAKKGMLLRASGNGGSSPYAIGMKQGYLFVSMRNSDGTVTLQPHIASAAGISLQQSFTSTFTVNTSSACWYRATANGSNLKFECSKDSITWEGGNFTAFTDNAYPGGTTQLIWGLGSDNYTWLMDNITFRSSKLSSSKLALSGFEYSQGQGPSGTQVFSVAGRSLNNNVSVNAPGNFEISLNQSGGYTSTLNISLVADSIPATNVYVRLKAGLVGNIYKENLTITSSDNSIVVPLSGRVKPTVVKFYDFSSDVASNTASMPPAGNISVATGNGATAGVASFTDLNSKTSNYLRPYSGGARNATGALDLNLFTEAADYSVVWKQVNGTAGRDYKVGMLLRGNTPEGTATTGYVQGLKQGYVFIVYSNGAAVPARSEFRIYKSTNATSLNILANVAVGTLAPVAGQPLWYRASVTGATNPALKLEYSTDSLTWNTGASTTDVASTFASGTAQFVWGLAAANWDSYVDNITQVEIPRPGIVSVSQETLTDLSYIKNAGPSLSKSFTVSGTSLAESISISAPVNFEVSLNPGAGYDASVSLAPVGGTIASTNIYTRLKSGLDAKAYKGEILLNYSPSGGSTDKIVSLNGSVSEPSIVVTTPSLLTGLGYISGFTSVVRSFVVSASTLSGALSVNAPENFEISLNAGADYTAMINLTSVNGTVAPTTVYVRLKSGLATATYTGEIMIASFSAAGKGIPVKATVSQEAIISLSETAFTELNYNYYSGTSPVKSFLVWGEPLAGDILVSAASNFEISLSADNGYASSIIIPMNNGVIDPTAIFVRLKSNLAEMLYTGNISLTSNSATEKTVSLSGYVSWSRIYDFDKDVAGTSPASGLSPALNITNASGNTATAGVVSYRDAMQLTSNRFQPYSGGQRNATGVMNLNLYPPNATNYSVSWKQSVGSGSLDYKVGVLLRGTTPVGDATTGYVQGMMNGYVFLAYTANGAATRHSEFRIYRSTSATSLTTLVNNSVSSLVPEVGQSVWYRASVAGSSPVEMKLEYSTDSISWITAATASDASATVFTAGATQLLWGLGSPNYNFYLDNITYKDFSNTLPVSMASFTARSEDGGKIRLNWRTLSEVNNAGFDIERSNSGKEFSKIGFVPGKGMTTSVSEYSFTDLSAYPGRSYYRLKQIDKDGAYSYSDVRTVFSGLSGGHQAAYPNPVSSILNIPSAGEKGSLAIVDISGRVIIKASLSGSEITAVDVSHLPAGLYFYQSNTQKGSFIKH